MSDKKGLFFVENKEELFYFIMYSYLIGLGEMVASVSLQTPDGKNLINADIKRGGETARTATSTKLYINKISPVDDCDVVSLYTIAPEEHQRLVYGEGEGTPYTMSINFYKTQGMYGTVNALNRVHIVEQKRRIIR